MTLGKRLAVPVTLLVAGAAFCCALVPPALAVAGPPPPPGLGLRLLEAPTARANDPRARSYIVDRIAPGGTFTRAFEVLNGDDTAMDVRLYPAAAQVEAGTFTVRDAGVPGEVVNWTTVTPGTLRLPPKSRTKAQVTVRVDPQATEGEYYGGLVAERPAQTTGAGVGVALRVAIRMYLSVGPGGEPASDFTIDTLSAQRAATGEPQVAAVVKNTGGRALDMSGKLRLTEGPGGLSAGPFTAKLGTTLAPGQSSPVAIVLDKALPAGPWRARLDLESGLVRRSATAVISFPAGAGDSAPSVKAEDVPLAQDRKILIPVAGGLIGLILLALLALALRARKLGKRADAADQ